MPRFNAQLRTTCVATMLEGGHARTRCRSSAGATVNCRVLPGESVDSVQAGPGARASPTTKIEVKRLATRSREPALAAPARPRRRRSRSSPAEFWPGAPIIPVMSAGATDGTHLRNAGMPTYGHSGMASEVQRTSARTAGTSACRVKSFYEGTEYLYRLVKVLAGGSSGDLLRGRPLPKLRLKRRAGSPYYPSQAAGCRNPHPPK